MTLLAQETRTWTSQSGKSIEARHVRTDGPYITLADQDGRYLRIHLEDLSESDRSFLASEKARRDESDPDDSGRTQHVDHDPKESSQAETVSPEQINEAMGVLLLGDDNLWDDDPYDAAARLQLPLESLTQTLASFRLYPRDEERILGIRPYSVALYCEHEHPTYLSLIFINKGDYSPFRKSLGMEFQSAGKARKHWKSLDIEFQEVMDHDGSKAKSVLEELFGQPRRTRFGQGKQMRERVSRWDWRGHVFLLAVTDDEAVSLRIMPTALADARGKGLDRVSDKDVRRILSQRVVRRPNGDVIVDQIPMVNQGPKGYCVPATWERCLRYMGIPADMYSLAIAGQTSKGGGTSIDAIIEGASKLVSSHGRRIKSVDPKMTLRNIARYIDDGLPIMWSMYIVDGLNKAWTRRALDRKGLDDLAPWKDKLKPLREAAGKLEIDIRGAHVCMIIGYNKDTEELALSDSWGPVFGERWITVEEAEAVSQNRMDVISW